MFLFEIVVNFFYAKPEKRPITDEAILKFDTVRIRSSLSQMGTHFAVETFTVLKPYKRLEKGVPTFSVYEILYIN
jgi:hypothetical protein